MSAYLLSVPSGVPGTITDEVNTVRVSGSFNSALMPTGYGVPVKLVGGLVSKIEAGDAADVFFGVLARANPNSSFDANFNGYGAGSPSVNQIPSIAIGGPGEITVKCSVGTPV